MAVALPRKSLHTIFSLLYFLNLFIPSLWVSFLTAFQSLALKICIWVYHFTWDLIIYYLMVLVRTSNFTTSHTINKFMTVLKTSKDALGGPKIMKHPSRRKVAGLSLRKEPKPKTKKKEDCWKYGSGTSLVVQWLRIRLPCRGHRFEPWSEKIPHAVEQLSPCTTTTEPAL